MYIISCRYGGPFWYWIWICYQACAVGAALDKADPHGGDQTESSQVSTEELTGSGDRSTASPSTTLLAVPSGTDGEAEGADPSSKPPTDHHSDLVIEVGETAVSVSPRRQRGSLRALLNSFPWKYRLYSGLLLAWIVIVHTLAFTGHGDWAVISLVMGSFLILTVFYVECYYRCQAWRHSRRNQRDRTLRKGKTASTLVQKRTDTGV